MPERSEGRIGLRDQGSRGIILATDGSGTLWGNRQEIQMEGTDWKKTGVWVKEVLYGVNIL